MSNESTAATTTTTAHLAAARPPPRLHFDDGSRIMAEADQALTSTTTTTSATATATAASSAHNDNDNDKYNDANNDNDTTKARGTINNKNNNNNNKNVPLKLYYEINRVAKEVVEKLDWSPATSSRGKLLKRVLDLSGTTSTTSSQLVVNHGGDESGNHDNHNHDDDDDDGFLCRIALQFPDELLSDAAQVSYLMEEAIVSCYREKILIGMPTTDNNNNDNDNDNETTAKQLQQQQQITITNQLISKHTNQPPLLFILGDTTYGSCCPDEVSSQHLNANVLVHYGYACLATPTENVPVVYCFGVSELGLLVNGVNSNSNSNMNLDDDGAMLGGWKNCTDLVLEEVKKNKKLPDTITQGDGDCEKQKQKQTKMNEKKNILLLYEVKYHHAIRDLKLALEDTQQILVVVGSIPKQQLSMKGLKKKQSLIENEKGCCGGSGNTNNDDGGGGGGGGACGVGSCGTTTGEVSAPSSGNDSCCESNNGSGCATAAAADADSAKSTNADASRSCCAESGNDSCCDNSTTGTCKNGNSDDATSPTPNTATNVQDDESSQHFYIPRTIGGLEIPNDLDISQFTLLYIGDDLDIDSNNSNAHTRLLHILLRCNSSDGTPSLWSYSPMRNSFLSDILNAPLSPTNSTALSASLSRILRRRYYLIQRAKLSTTIAILIGTTSNSYSFRRLLSRTRHRIQSTGRTAYTFAVGKLASAPSKLSNFAEIDCFVLISCGETIAKFWKMEREEMLVPVITPMELDVALGVRDWDGRYSCDFGDLIRWDKEDGVEDDYYDDADGDIVYNDGNAHGKASAGKSQEEGDGNSSSDDEPFFSTISGKYEQSRAKQAGSNDSDLQALPGQGQLTEYKSEAAEFLKNREYRGLEANVGQTEAKAAVQGLVGIASDYGETR